MAIRLGVLLLCASATCFSVADEPLKVLAYNIRYANPGDGPDVWPNRAGAVAECIAENDIVGLQEVTLAQLVDLRERLGEFDSYGVGRDDGISSGEHAVIFYRRDRLEELDKGTFWLSENPDTVGGKGWDAALPRTCTWILLRDKSADRRLWIANTHFDHRGQVARTESAKLIRRVAGERADSLPVIVLGDFNCVPGSDPYRALTDGVLAAGSADPPSLADARLVSKTPPKGPTSTWNGFREIVPGRIIDHIFVRGPIEVVALETLNPTTQSGRFASDHLPVQTLVRVRLAAESAEAIQRATGGE